AAAEDFGVDRRDEPDEPDPCQQGEAGREGDDQREHEGHQRDAEGEQRAAGEELPLDRRQEHRLSSRRDGAPYSFSQAFSAVMPGGGMSSWLPPVVCLISASSLPDAIRSASPRL